MIKQCFVNKHLLLAFVFYRYICESKKRKPITTAYFQSSTVQPASPETTLDKSRQAYMYGAGCSTFIRDIDSRFQCMAKCIERNVCLSVYFLPLERTCYLVTFTEQLLNPAVISKSGHAVLKYTIRYHD